MALRTVSQILLEDHGIRIRPGGKGECPVCKLAYFSLKGDDSLGKCFHPPCGHYLTRESAHDGYGLSRVLQAFAHECHQALLALAGTPGQHAYRYLTEERRVHPHVVAESRVGVVPYGIDVTPYFQPSLQDAKDSLATLQAQGKKGARHAQALERAAQRLEDLQRACQALHDCLAHRTGWLIFFYADSAYRLVALRLREPYSRRFASFKPGIAGVFGRELFTPSQSPDKQDVNQHLLVVEGEFNALTLQSLTLHYEAATGQPLGYLHCCAVGGVTIADVETVRRSAAHPVVWYDHDTNGAGLELVARLQKAMPLEACTASVCPSDPDSFIQDFAPDAVAAWQAVQAVIGQRTAYGRVYSGTGEEFFDTTTSSPRTPVFVPTLLGDTLLAREQYRHTAALLWGYQHGVYVPYGAERVRVDCQTLLGPERHHHRIEEALDYVCVAVHMPEEETPPDCQTINVQNGRLDWHTGQLTPHTPAIFSTAQLPIAYDPDACCSAFDAYLSSTFDPDVWPLIEELLGWCLVPDRRFEKAVLLTGETGENGKSVLIDLVSDLLGQDNVSHVALQDLEENRFRVAELYGKLANVFADLDMRAMQSSSMFKTLVTGDTITAERKHQHPFTFRNYAKLLFSANKIPASKDRTPAFYRRWIIVPFTRTFNGQGGNPPPDKGLRDKLKAELAGIFNRALTGLARLNAQEAFTEPTSVRDAKARYIRQNDNVRAFLDECVDLLPIGTIEKSTFYRVYIQWCQAAGERPVSQKALKVTLAEYVPNLDEWRKDANSPRCWLGMEWNDDASEYFSATFGPGSTHEREPGSDG